MKSKNGFTETYMSRLPNKYIYKIIRIKMGKSLGLEHVNVNMMNEVVLYVTILRGPKEEDMSF